MIHAAHNGKKVTVVVELQARFDEEANIHWAKRLTEAGVHVIFSAPGLKIHAKLFLISRKEGDGTYTVGITEHAQELLGAIVCADWCRRHAIF